MTFLGVVVGLVVVIAAITAGVVFATPKVLDALLFYFDKRVKQLNQIRQIQERTLAIMKEQYEQQERRR